MYVDDEFDVVHYGELVDENVNSVRNMFKTCLESSIFYRDTVTLDDLMKRFNACYGEYILPPDHGLTEWPVEKNDVSMLVDGIAINAQILNTVNSDDIYLKPKKDYEEEVLDWAYNKDMEKVPPISHAIGIKMTELSEHLSDIYTDVVNDGKGLEDIVPSEMSKYFGNLTAAPWFDNPTPSQMTDSPRSTYIRRIMNYMLRDVSPGERILVIGGDGGSASRRQREYSIDCLYFDIEKYDIAKKERKKYGGLGLDYLYGHDFVLEAHLPDEWVVATFNYYGESALLDLFYEFFKNSQTQVWGVVLSPVWDDAECVVSTAQYREGELEKLPINLSKATTHRYQILGRREEKVAVYTTHGRFEDVIINYEREWLYQIPFVVLDKVVPKESYSPYVHSLMHTSLYVMRTLNEKYVFEKEMFPIPVGYNTFPYCFNASIRGNELFDDEGTLLFKNIQNSVETRVLCYRGPIMSRTGELVEGDHLIVLDADISGSYSMRRKFIYSMGFKYYGYGYIFRRYDMKWHELPLDNLLSVVNIVDKVVTKDVEVVETVLDVYRSDVFSESFSTTNQQRKFDEMVRMSKFVTNKLIRMPALLIKGLSYNPLRKMLVYDDLGVGFLLGIRDYRHKFMNADFTSDIAVPVFISGECLSHGCDLLSCEFFDEGKCNNSMSLSLHEKNVNDHPMMIYFRGFSYSDRHVPFDKFGLDTVSVADSFDML